MKFLDLAGAQRLWNALTQRASAGLVQLQSSGDWVFWTSGSAFEAFYTKADVSLSITTADGGVYRSDLQTLTLPAAITGAGTVAIKHAEINCAGGSNACWAALAGTSSTGVTWHAASGASRTTNCLVTAKIMGTIS